jgi:hypothetical protein
MGEDVVFRSMARLLGEEFIRNYGLEPVQVEEMLEPEEVLREEPTDLPFVVGERRVDGLFRLADGKLLHLEFQSTATDLARFLFQEVTFLPGIS